MGHADRLGAEHPAAHSWHPGEDPATATQVEVTVTPDGDGCVVRCATRLGPARGDLDAEGTRRGWPLVRPLRGPGDPVGEVGPAVVHAVDVETLDPDLLVEDRQLERRHQRGGEELQVAADPELAEQVAHVRGDEGVRRVRAVAPRSRRCGSGPRA